MSRTPRLERLTALLVATLLPTQLLVLAARSGDGPATASGGDRAVVEASSPAAGPTGQADPPPSLGAAAPSKPSEAATRTEPGTAAASSPQRDGPRTAPPSEGHTDGAGDPTGPRATVRRTQPKAAVAVGAGDPARDRFERAYPEHAAARQDADDSATTRWAVLIGINDHEGRTRDNVASRQDAEDLERLLLTRGWHQDHVLVLTDRMATAERIEQALRWLARKTDEHSVAIVHYSGHTKQWDHDVDGDGEVVDEGLWPSDNRHITDRAFVALVDGIAGRLWVNIAACEAAGLADPGLARAGRVLTLSSREDEKSYEDPSVANSVWGYFMIEEGLSKRYADADNDGDVSVQEAFAFAAPRAEQRTSRQVHGPQRPVIDDRLGAAFSLQIPRSSSDQPEDDRCTLGICFGDDDQRRS